MAYNSRKNKRKVKGDKMSKQSKLFGEDEEIKKVEKLDLKTAENIASTIASLVDAWCQKIEVVGSIRRKRPEIHDIDLVVLTYEDEHDEHWKGLKDSMITFAGVKVVLNGDEIFRTLMPLEGGEWVQVDFYRAKPETYGIHKLIRTGSAEHNVYLAKLAIKKGMRLQYSKGLMKDGEVIAGKNESDVLHGLGLPWIPPELREIISGKPAWEGKV
jgi:DNA polymerase (family 10)